MKLLYDDLLFHPHVEMMGVVRHLIWETGNDEKPYLVAAVSYAVKGYTQDGELVDEHDPRAVKYDWFWYRITDLCDDLNIAWNAYPTPKDVVPVSNGDGYVSVAEADEAAGEYMDSLTPEDFRPQDYEEVLELGLHKLLP